jgi:hypothetical protein
MPVKKLPPDGKIRKPQPVVQAAVKAAVKDVPKGGPKQLVRSSTRVAERTKLGLKTPNAPKLMPLPGPPPPKDWKYWPEPPDKITPEMKKKRKY